MSPVASDARSVHVGIDRIDPALFGPAFPALLSAEKDARNLRAVADRMGCASRLIEGAGATRGAVLAALSGASSRMRPGDFLMITFSGHGARVPGAPGERDGKEEAWCAHDGLVLDDDLLRILAQAPAGADVLVVNDACFAAGMFEADAAGEAADSPRSRRPAAATGTAPRNVVRPGPSLDVLRIAGTDAPERIVPRMSAGGCAAARPILRRLARGPRAELRARRSPEPVVRANVLSISASGVRCPAYEGPEAGLLTAALLSWIAAGEPDSGIDGLVRWLTRAMGRQRPCVRSLGDPGAARRLLELCSAARRDEATASPARA